MPLTPGVRLGPYEVIAQLGVGGMGEVWRATDTNLKRAVALKVLPEAVAADRDRLARFQREAEVLAALNHPNIAHIHGLEKSGGTTALVMELVEGPTLADRIANGPIPLDETLPIAKQIAEALEAAHEQGIIHRDLKPANVKVREDGTVKVLDFGLAKAMEPPPGSYDISNSPTITSPAMTQQGVILGTAAYMSPEQARGRPVDKRTDVWAFGAVLFEMLTGVRPFVGEDVTEIIGAVVHKDPDWRTLPARTPLPLRDLLERCLTKDRRQRLRDIGDARFDLDRALSAEHAGAAETRRRSVRLPRLIAFGVVAALAAGVGWLAAHRAPAPNPGLKRFLVHMGSAPLRGDDLALSPDGTQLAYVSGSYEASQLYIRALDQPRARLLAGTTGAANPFFSPDGQWIGFATVTGLKKIPVGGGPVTTLTNRGSAGSIATWGRDGTIVFDLSQSEQLWTVSSAGGTAEPFSELDPSQGEIAHLWPQILPNGAGVIFTVLTSTSAEAYRVVLQPQGSKTHRVLLEGAAEASYAPTGHLVFVQSGTLVAAPFDLATLAVRSADAKPIPVGVSMTAETTPTRYFLTADGTLALIERSREARRTLLWVDRRGVASELGVPSRAYRSPVFSSDGKRLAVTVTEGPDQGLWVGDPHRPDSLARLLTGDADFATWTPDARAVTYATRPAAGRYEIQSQGVDGFRAPDVLTENPRGSWPGSWSRDGSALTVMSTTADGGGDIFLYERGTSKLRPLIQTPATEWGAKLSPDNRWIAFVSNESGQWRVYVQPFPGPGNRKQISVDGGVEVAWARRGQQLELIYRVGQRLMSVAFANTPDVSIGTPQALFEGPYLLGSPGGHNYDVTPDGERFLMIKAANEGAPDQLHVVLNWFEELKRLVPTP